MASSFRSRVVIEKEPDFHFNPFPYLVESAGLYRYKVEMGKGNDGLGRKLRQQASAQHEGEGRGTIAQWLEAGCDAVMSSLCHSLNSFVVKMVVGE